MGSRAKGGAPHSPINRIHVLGIRCRSETRQGTVVDRGFPRGRGANPPGRGANIRNIRFCQIFPKYYVKLKEFGPGGRVRPKCYYVDPPLGRIGTDVPVGGWE